MLTILLALVSVLAVMWAFGVYEIILNVRNGVSFNLRTAFLARWSTPSCITCAIGVFAGVILIRA
jgi:hypothetical protein